MRTGVALVGAGTVLAAALTACGSTTATLTTQDGTVAAAGVATRGAGSAHLTFVGVVGGKKITGSGDANLATNATRLTVSGAGTRIDEILVRDVLYVRSSELAGQLDPGKTWLSENLDTISKAEYGVALSDLSSSNPLGALDQLGSSSGAAKKGTAVIGGVTCTHYAGSIALSKEAAAQSDPAVRAGLLKLAAQFHGKIGIQVWVGPDGLIRQLTESLPPISAASLTIPATSETVTLSRFGEKVAVTAPASGTVQDFTQAAVDEISNGTL